MYPYCTARGMKVCVCGQCRPTQSADQKHAADQSHSPRGFEPASMMSTSLQLVQSQSTKISNTCQVILTLLLLRVEQQLLQIVPCLCRYNETKHSNPVPAKGKEGSGDLHANPLKVRHIQVSKKPLQQRITSEDLYTSVMYRSTIQHCPPGLLDHAYESLTPPFQLRTIPSAPPHHTAVRWRCSAHVTLTCP